jgi:hypothetical protein
LFVRIRIADWHQVSGGSLIPHKLSRNLRYLVGFRSSAIAPQALAAVAASYP